MALKKPADLFNKKETSGVFQALEVSSHITESYDKFFNNFERVNELSAKVEELSKELNEKLSRTELENAMLSQLMVLDENFKVIQNEVKGLNKKDLKEFKDTVYNLTEIVDNLVKTELPKYKKQVVKSEVFVGEQVQKLQDNVNSNLTNFQEEIDVKFDNIAEVVDNNINYFNQKLQETSSEVKKTTETYNNLSKIVENKVLKENQILEEYSNTIESIQKEFNTLKNFIEEENNTYQEFIQNYIQERIVEVSSNINESFNTFSYNVNNQIKEVTENVTNIQDKVSGEVSSLKADVVIFEKHNKNTEKTIQEFSDRLSLLQNVDEDLEKLKTQYTELNTETKETKKDLEVVERYIQNHHQDIEVLKEEVFTEIEKLPVGNLQENIERLEKKIDYIRETYSKIEPEVIVKEVIREGLLNEPPETKNEDPLTSLNQNFVTLDQLQQHYRLFLNRIQQQLSTLGGGGETQLKYLDDIVGIATNASAYDNKYLKYNHSLGKFEFTSVDISNDSWDDGINGPYTNGNVGIGTSVANTSLDVIGDASISGVITASSFIGNSGTIDNISGVNLNYSGIATVASLSIGSTQVISASRQLQNITSLDAITTATIESAIANAPNTFTDINVTGIATFNNINATGIITASSFSGNATSATYATTSGVSTSVIGGIGSITQLSVSGIATVNTELDVGVGGTIFTALSNGRIGVGSAIPTVTLDVIGNSRIVGVITATTFSGNLTGNVTGNLNSSGVNTATTISGTTATYTTGNFTTGNIVTGIVTSISGTNLNYTGISTITNVRSTTLNNSGVGTITTLSGTTANYTTGNFTTGNIVTGIVTTISGTQSTYTNATIGVGTVTTLNYGTVAGISTAITTVATTAATTIDSFSATVFRSARVQVQITQGTNYQASDILIIHDGASAFIVEYGSVATGNSYLCNFTSAVSAGNCLLQINMSSATSATIKVLSQRITI